MSNIAGTTRAQTSFLRAFRNNPAGPAPTDWPSPAILRRWLRRPAFRRALQSVQDVLSFQADFHLTVAATDAARKLIAADPASPALNHQDVRQLTQLLRLAHLRQRFPAQVNLNSPATVEQQSVENWPEKEFDDDDDDDDDFDLDDDDDDW
ncbi:MAG TPA: hypothetical protein VH475_22560 [Tepidisphaeraceae bacterium]